MQLNKLLFIIHNLVHEKKLMKIKFSLK